VIIGDTARADAVEGWLINLAVRVIKVADVILDCPNFQIAND